MFDTVLYKLVPQEFILKNTTVKQQLLFWGNSQHLCSKTFILAV